MTSESAVAFVCALLLWVAIPGPAIFAIIGRSLASGFRPALTLIAGILLGDCFYIIIAILGMAAIGQAFENVFLLIKLGGAACLVFMGIRLWFAPPTLWNDTPTHTTANGVRHFLTGFAITLGNPRAILFHLGFLPTFFDLPHLSAGEAFLIVGIFTTVLGSTLIVYAYAATRARMLFKRPHTLRMLNRGAGTLLIGTGIAVATRQ
jgi:threonine/homoserine/homoserine lactone efflux protein